MVKNIDAMSRSIMSPLSCTIVVLALLVVTLPGSKSNLTTESTPDNTLYNDTTNNFDIYEPNPDYEYNRGYQYDTSNDYDNDYQYDTDNNYENEYQFDSSTQHDSYIRKVRLSEKLNLTCEDKQRIGENVSCCWSFSWSCFLSSVI